MTKEDFNFFDKEAEVAVFLNDKLIAYSRKKQQEILEALELKEPEEQRLEIPVKYHFLFYSEQLARRLIVYNRYSMDDRIYVNTIVRIWTGTGYTQVIVEDINLPKLYNAFRKAHRWHQRIRQKDFYFQNWSLDKRIEFFRKLPGLYGKETEQYYMLGHAQKPQIKISEQKEANSDFYKVPE